MRIIGGKDFYDGVQSMGQDSSVVFVRSEREKVDGEPGKSTGLAKMTKFRLNLKDEDISNYRNFTRLEDKNTVTVLKPVTVYFAGTRYNFFSCFVFDKTRNGAMISYGPLDKADFVIKSGSELRHILKKYGMEFKNVKKDRLSLGLTSNEINENEVDEWFEAGATKAELNWLVENKRSIALSCLVGISDHFALNLSEWRAKRGWKFDVDGLDFYGFAKVLDPYQAYQNLSQWVGGVIANTGNPTVEITAEKYKLAKHGFDKWSFKKIGENSKV